jgi:hypothetical protein
MSILREPTFANLTVSIMYKNEDKMNQALDFMKERFGEIDFSSEAFVFSDISPYYNPEMGDIIYKRIFSFKKLVPRDVMIEAKHLAVDIENKFIKDGKREVNLDPGLLSLENFILVTGKNFSHRIYLGKGVFAEITLILKAKKIEILPWSYKDYQMEPAKTFLLNLREIFKKKLKSEN